MLKKTANAVGVAAACALGTTLVTIIAFHEITWVHSLFVGPGQETAAREKLSAPLPEIDAPGYAPALGDAEIPAPTLEEPPASVIEKDIRFAEGKGANPRELAKLWNDAAKKIKKGDYQAAEKLLTRALAMDPDNPEIQKALSMTYTHRGFSELDASDYESALKSFALARSFWDRNPGAALGIGKAYYYDNDMENAEAWLKYCAGLGAPGPEAYNLLADICYHSDRLDEALEYLGASLRIDPSQKKAHEFMARIRKEMKIEGDFYSSATSHFIVKYEGKKIPHASMIVMATCEEAYSLVGARLKYYPKDKIMVVLYTNQQFRDVTRAPSWAGASYDGKVRIPAMGLTQKNNILDRIVFHEYTHAVIHQYTHGNAPVWLHEGLAQMSEGMDYDLSELAEELVMYKGPAPLEYFEKGFGGLPPETARLAYNQCLLATSYIEQAFGPYALTRILDNLAQGQNIGQAITSATYKSPETFEQEFRKWVKDEAAGY